ncbi:DUF2997 domain-containing protein [Dactylosporangium siamense]|uniref:DUF2997 domain-containing protein n=1 Tax=Dactylosporangium siamense TaxID=685454 RepID=A0A919PR61_9ACTN|nr:DUF2997 domain-containing protein [Dactylosporangium siamense]GIG46818.1 hypothetical protein Dsi01nite_048590 [Dactylosporangium siamense]
MNPRIIVTVAADGQISAKTEGLLGEACLDYIAVLEDLLDARTVDSAYTADYTRVHTDVRTVETQHDVERT